ncbi:MAG: sulfurtransferase [Gammaproteobacteria bacterium]|nr:sulfurtransferase [Gammaproteobacteria bacterium]
MREFSPLQLRDHLANTDNDPLLLDVREPWEFRLCSIEGSQLIPMGQLQGALKALDPERETVVICHHGIRSRHVAYYLDHLGFANVINLSTGVDGWARDVDRHMATY